MSTDDGSLYPLCPNSQSSWFSCTTGTLFLGCCDPLADPCNGSGCPSDNLQPASYDIFDASGYANQSCQDDAQWYTCPRGANQTYPFLGCCKSDPCGDDTDFMSCPEGDLVAGKLNIMSDHGYLSWQASETSSAAPTKVVSSEIATLTAGVSPATVTVQVDDPDAFTLYHPTVSSMTPLMTGVPLSAEPDITSHASSHFSTGVTVALAVAGIVAALSLMFAFVCWRRCEQWKTVVRRERFKLGLPRGTNLRQQAPSSPQPPELPQTYAAAHHPGGQNSPRNLGGYHGMRPIGKDVELGEVRGSSVVELPASGTKAV